jgi:hypothetical protein
MGSILLRVHYVPIVGGTNLTYLRPNGLRVLSSLSTTITHGAYPYRLSKHRMKSYFFSTLTIRSRLCVVITKHCLAIEHSR